MIVASLKVYGETCSVILDLSSRAGRLMTIADTDAHIVRLFR